MTELKLEFGKAYRRRDGRKVVITSSYSGRQRYPFESDTGETYQEDGRWHWAGEDNRDIIALWPEAVDLSKLKVGDKIRLLSGATADVRRIQIGKDGSYGVRFSSDNSLGSFWFYDPSGHVKGLGDYHSDTIVEILSAAPKAVDLSKLKVGDKVRTKNGGIITISEIAGPDDDGTYYVEFVRENGTGDFWWYRADGSLTNLGRDEPDIITEILPATPEAVDLSKLKVGDTVFFRCGGSSKVTWIKDKGGSENNYRYGIIFENKCGVNPAHDSPDFWYQRTGTYHGTATEFPFDIIRVEPAVVKEPEFDWSTVKPGMAFKSASDDVSVPVWYVGPCLSRKDSVCVTDSKTDQLRHNMWHFEKSALVRAPEHDTPAVE